MVARRRLLTVATGLGTGAVLGATASAPNLATAAASRATGGSNYGWYRLDGCTREPYGVVNTFHTARDTILTQLGQLYAAGQRRLRVLVYHRRGPDTGTVMDSTGGTLSAQNRQNLTDLLAAIRAAGFAEMQVSFLPIGGNFAANWSAWNEDVYQENWNLIYHLHPVISGAGVPYRIDLCNEAVPASSQPVLLQYAQRLWSDYTYVFGKDDTCGFSVIGSDTDRIKNIPNVYRGNPPYLFDFHFYRNSVDEYQQFVSAHALMNQLGYGGQGWTISEAYYNDATAAANLHRAITDTGRTVFWLLQWPVRPGAACADVSVAPPLDFSAYTSQGF